MYCGRVHRMILWELFKVSALSLIALNGMILMGGIVGEATRNGLGPKQIMNMIPLFIPSLLPYTIPTTTLFATCIVYGRLSADNEVIALKAAGVHIIHVVWPALLLGAAATALTLWLYVDIIPTTRFKMRSRLVGDIEDLLYAMLRKDGCIKHPKVDVEIHVNSIRGKKLQDVLFQKKSVDGKGFDFVARAKEAELRVEMANKRLLIHMFHCEVVHANGGGEGIFDAQILTVDLPKEIYDPSPTKYKPSDMTWLELDEHEAELLEKRRTLSEDIDLHQAMLNLNGGPPQFVTHINNRVNERKDVDRQLAFVDSERHSRPAIALGCLCFALVGCPVGMWFSRSDYLSAFIACFLPIVTLYYPLLLSMINLTRSGRIPPAVGLYDADAIMLLAGGVLFYRLTRN